MTNRAEMSTNKGKYKRTVDGMHGLGVSEWGEVQSIFKVPINFSPDVLDLSVIDRTPPSAYLGLLTEKWAAVPTRGEPVTPFNGS